MKKFHDIPRRSVEAAMFKRREMNKTVADEVNLLADVCAWIASHSTDPVARELMYAALEMEGPFVTGE